MGAIDDIYEAAFIPERWPAVLEQMSRLSGSQSAALWVFGDDRPARGLSTDMARELVEAFLQSEAWRTSASVRWTLEARPSRFSSIEANVPPDALAGDPGWEPLAALGYGERLTSVVQLPGGEMAAYVLARMKRNGAYRARDAAALNRLRPHLTRAAQITARLSLDHARAMVETLDRLGLAGAVLDRRGRVIAANALLEKLPETLVPTAFGGIAIAGRMADERFQAALARIGTDAAGSVISLPVAGSAETPPLLVHLLPVCGDARDIFGGGHVLMVAVAVARRDAPRPELLDGLFDLTQAEARLAGELARGGSLPAIAARVGLSHHTLRAQLRSVLAKTGVHRQAELLQLLAAL